MTAKATAKRALVARLLPWGVGLTLACTFAGSYWLNASVVTAVGCVVGASLAIAGLFGGARTFTTPVTVSLMATSLAIAVFSLTSAFSARPAISFVGAVGQHNGTALWALGGVWLLAGLLGADQKALRSTLIVTSLAGATYSLALHVEALTRGLARAQGAAAGQFENSTSYGEFAAIAALSTIAWILISRSRLERAAAYGALGLLASGMLASSSRAGALAFCTALLFATAIARVPAGRGPRVALALAPAAFALCATVAAALAATGMLGGPIQQLLATVGTDRDAVWRSAVAQLGQAPLTGSGLEQYSAWVAVTTSGGSGAFDPHNVVLAVALGAGPVGVLCVTVALVALTWAAVDAAQRKPSRFSTALVASMPVALVGAGLVAWLTPASVLVALAGVGAMLGAAPTDPRTAPSWPGPLSGRWAVVIPGGFLACAALLLGGLAIAALPSMATYARMQTSPDPTILAEQYTRWPDPAYAVLAIRQLTPQVADPKAADLLRQILSASEPDTTWRVDSAAAQLIATRALTGTETASFETVRALAQNGAQADPTSGIWWALAADDARRRGLDDDARTYAKSALSFPLPDDLRLSMEQLLGSP